MNSVNPNDKAVALFNTIPQAPFNVINPKNKRLIAKVGNECISIIDKRKKEYIDTLGINIPPFLRERFGDKTVIQHDDPLFYQAFITAECWNLLRSGYRIDKQDQGLENIKLTQSIEN